MANTYSRPSRSSGNNRASRGSQPARRARNGRGSRQRYETANATFVGRLRLSIARGGRALSLHGRARQLAIALLTAAIVLVSLVLWLALDNRFYVYNAEVVGNAHTPYEDVFVASDLGGVHVLWARPGRAARLITAGVPNIESADVTCGLPARCTITIVERQPRMAWEDNGAVWWVDADGVVMPAQGLLTEGWVVRGPLPLMDSAAVEGLEGAIEGQRRLKEPVRVALNELWAAGFDGAAVFRYVQGRGLVTTDPRGWPVVLGEGSGMARRLQLADWVGSDLQARGLTPTYVDVRFLDAPYYSLSNQS